MDILSVALLVLAVVWLYGVVWLTRVLVVVVAPFNKRLKAARLATGRVYPETPAKKEVWGFLVTYSLGAAVVGMFAWRPATRYGVYNGIIGAMKEEVPDITQEEYNSLCHAFEAFETQ